MDEKELILQGLDLLIYETEYAITNSNANIKKSQYETKLEVLDKLKKKIIDGKLVIQD